jgi:hypothetical protein
MAGMNLRDMNKMLEDQQLLVIAAHEVRMEALGKYGPLSWQYQKATDFYERENLRYQTMHAESRREKLHAELEEFQGFLMEQITGYLSPPVSEYLEEEYEADDRKAEPERMPRPRDYHQVIERRSEALPRLPNGKK